MSEGNFAPFFRVAGSGYAIDEKGTPEYNQLRYGWQSQWRVEDDELERHSRSKNPCVVYDLPRRRRNAADVVAACEAEVKHRIKRCFIPDGESFAILTCESEEGAAALCARGLRFDDDDDDDDDDAETTGVNDGTNERSSSGTCRVEALRVPGPAVTRWRRRLRGEEA
jgi:hypothetical protein